MHKEIEYKIEITSPDKKVFQVKEKAISEKEALLKMMFQAERDGKVEEYATPWQNEYTEDATVRKVVTLAGIYKVVCKIQAGGK